MTQTIYIARHGFRMNWDTQNWSTPTKLARDPPLTAFGQMQAEELAVYFTSLPEDQRPQAIFSSPYYRCLQTAQPIAERLKLPIYVEHGFSEWYSPVSPNTGLHPRPATASSLRKHISQIDPSWSSTWIPPRKGEDVKELNDRCEDCLAAFIGRLEEPASPIPHERILIVSHAATVIALTKALLGTPNLNLRVGCCSLTTFHRDKSADVGCLGKWKADKDGLASGQHLKDGSLRDWGMEDVEISDGQVVSDDGEAGTEHDVDDQFGLQYFQVEKVSESTAAKM